MPIREKSFRIGCGRYLQERGALSALGDEVKRLGSAPLVIGGRTALSLTRPIIEKSLSAACARYEIIEHTGTCNEPRAEELAALAHEKGYDVIVGVGGGVLMDFAKLCGYFAKLPVINVPTSSATCAAYTPLSVRYTPEGRTVGTRHYDYEVNAVIADTDIIATQPVRLLLAGVFDAVAKFIEIKHRYREDAPNNDAPMGLDYAYMMSKYSYRFLTENTAACIEDMQAGNITERLENLIFTTIAATGVISGVARGSNQSALAHKFYENTRTMFHETARPYLHGEIVGIGLLLQNHFNGEPEQNEHLLTLMKQNNMPHRLRDIGIDPTDAALEEYYTRLCACSSIDENNAEECARLHTSLEYLWTFQ